MDGEQSPAQDPLSPPPLEVADAAVSNTELRMYLGLLTSLYCLHLGRTGLAIEWLCGPNGIDKIIDAAVEGAESERAAGLVKVSVIIEKSKAHPSTFDSFCHSFYFGFRSRFQLAKLVSNLTFPCFLELKSSASVYLPLLLPGSRRAIRGRKSVSWKVSGLWTPVSKTWLANFVWLDRQKFAKAGSG